MGGPRASVIKIRFPSRALVRALPENICFGIPVSGWRDYKTQPHCKGPTIENIQDLPPGLKLSSKTDKLNVKRATRHWPLFCREFGRSRLYFSSEIEIYKRDWTFLARCFLSSFGPLGKGILWLWFWGGSKEQKKHTYLSFLLLGPHPKPPPFGPIELKGLCPCFLGKIPKK